MAHVEVVNAQPIDGVERERGEVIEVSDGRARDLVAAGKANWATTPSAVTNEADKATPKPAPEKKEGGKNA